MPNSFSSDRILSEHPLQNRASITSIAKTQDLKYDVPDNQPKCDAAQCGIVEQNIKDMTNSTGSIMSNIAGGMGVNAEFWEMFERTMQEFNNNPERNEHIDAQKMERDYQQASQNVNSAQKEYDFFLKQYCDANPASEICMELEQLKRAVAEGKVNDLKDKASEIKDNILLLIDTYSAEKLALDRMQELLGTRLKEINVDINTIDNVVQTIQTDSRKGFYQTEQHDFIGEIKILLIFIYYILFLFYLFVSDFFPGQGYKSISTILFIIIFLIVPPFIQYIVSFFYTLINSFFIRFDLKKNDIESQVIAAPIKYN